jgi:hypothetical protein
MKIESKKIAQLKDDLRHHRVHLKSYRKLLKEIRDKQKDVVSRIDYHYKGTEETMGKICKLFKID